MAPYSTPPPASRPPRHSGPTTSESLHRLFTREPHPPTPQGLLDHPTARRWFELLRWGYDEGLYAYQQPLEGRTGPHVRLAGRSMLMLSSHDCLGLVGHPAIEEAAVAAVRRYGTSSAGARMLTGTTVLHQELERDLAAFKGVDAAMIVGSGYLAALAVITALLGPRDRVLLDARAQRSWRDACALARVPVRTFRHNDPAALRQELARGRRGARTVIVVEGLYGMDGDICPLPELVAVKREFDAFLVVDEAYSLGVLGAEGRGVDQHFGLPAAGVDVWTGSLAKVIPANGGFVAGSRELIVYLQHTVGRAWFSTALCPAAVAAAGAALRVLHREPERLARMRRNAATLRAGLGALGCDTGGSASAIVPVIVGDDEAAWRLARTLFDRGVVASAVVYPVVRRGEARLRLCASASHSERDLAQALDAFGAVRDAALHSAPAGP
ncbi:MAG: aminotransferase class I/II-fold pyridoxal phosphate-dependent enzyme [Gemmatimonadales bacterium]